MKILLVNAVCGTGSTGRLCANIAQEFASEGHTVKIAYGRSGNVPEQFREYAVRIGSGIDVRLHGIWTRIFDAHGLGSKSATRRFLEWAEDYMPDLLWLHNIHGYYINYELLFDWIKKHPEMDVRWTLHDCWAFTGHCSHFAAVNCEKWMSHCFACPQKGEYPKSLLFDRCGENFEKKRRAFCGVRKMSLITPSRWLAELVKQSFLQEYPVAVRYNTVDTRIFRPVPSDFRQRYNIQNKKIILGAASTWSERKGLRDFIKLVGLLDHSYVIVLVGLSDVQRKQLKGNIIGIRRTNDAQELAEIYSAADVFFNPTYEDNYPTVNLEAEACGTPVVTYNSGGSAETLHSCESAAVPPGDLDKSVQLLQKICERQSTR